MLRANSICRSQNKLFSIAKWSVYLRYVDYSHSCDIFRASTMLEWTFGCTTDRLFVGCLMRMMQNNGAFNVLSAANSIPLWNLGSLQPSTSHSNSGGSAGMLPSASSSTVRPPVRDGELAGFREERWKFALVLLFCYVCNIFCDADGYPCDFGCKISHA